MSRQRGREKATCNALQGEKVTCLALSSAASGRAHPVKRLETTAVTRPLVDHQRVRLELAVLHGEGDVRPHAGLQQPLEVPGDAGRRHHHVLLRVQQACACGGRRRLAGHHLELEAALHCEAVVGTHET